MRKIGLSAILLLVYISAFAQQNQPVEMADLLRSSGKIYVVIAIIATVFIGLAFYLFWMDRRLRKIEKDQ